MKRLISIGLVAALSVASAFAADQPAAPAAPPAGAGPPPPTPEQQAKTSIETRQGLFKVISFNNAPIVGMLRGRVPFDAALVARNAERIAQLGAMIPDVFAADTRTTGAGVKTLALDGIWTSQADFKAKADDLVKAATALAAAAKTGDKDATLKAAGGLKACGSCHDTYRAKP